MEEKIKRSFSVEKKLEILRKHLRNRVLSSLRFVKNMEFTPIEFTKFKKQLFEGGKEFF